MIPQTDLELLTLAVDGELSAREARELHRVLEASAEARTLFTRLQADRQRLRRLPDVRPPANLAAQVVARVSQLPAHHAPIRTYPRPSAPARRSPRVPIAVAASLLFAIGTVSIVYGIRMSSRGPAGEFANDTNAARPGARGPSPDPWRNALPNETGPLASRPADDLERERPLAPAPRLEVPAPKPPKTEVAAAPRPVPPRDFLTAPLSATPSPFETIQVRLPFLASLAEIKDRPEARENLLRELQRDPAYRLDLFGANPNKGLDLLLNTIKGTGIAVHFDAAAHERNRKKLPTTYVVYVESLSATEIRDLLAKLAVADSRHPVREFETLHLSPAQAADQRELKDLLGTDPGLWKRPDANSASRGIAAGTADAVAKAVANGTAGKGSERPAVVLASHPQLVRVKPAASKELQQFLTKRGERKPTSVPLMIVVRGL